MDDLQENLSISLPEFRYTTLAGFLLERSHGMSSASKVIEHVQISFSNR